MKRAFITGVGGQDGSYLAEYLLIKDYTVYGLVRRSSVDNTVRLKGVLENPKFKLLHGDVTDLNQLSHVIGAIGWPPFDEVYHLADQDNVDFSLKTPLYSWDVTAKGTANLLEWLRCRSYNGLPKIFLPISATVFGANDCPHNINTPLDPSSPYACAKAAAWLLGKHYRREHGMQIYHGILYNHESTRRGPHYFLQRICKEAVEVKLGRRKQIDLYSPDVILSIGWAPDFVVGFHQLLQYPTPSDFIFCGPRVLASLWTRFVLEVVKIDFSPGSINWKEGNYRKGGIHNVYGNTFHTSSLLGWHQSTGVYDMVSQLIRHWEKQLCE